MTTPDTEPEEVRVALKPNWDATLHYGLLKPDEHLPNPDEHLLNPYEQGSVQNEKPIFVGRDDLLGPLVHAISEPARRGTYLVSGYRGAGKTSLVIKAALDASTRLHDKGWTLLPIVLNVSEVSASLDSGSDAESQQLRIDARHLLMALVRALHNDLPTVLHLREPEKPEEPKSRWLGRVWHQLWHRGSSAERTHREVDDDYERKLKRYRADQQLCDKVTSTYEKAAAASFEERHKQQLESRETETVETERKFGVPNLFALVAALAAAAAVVVEAIAWLGPGLAVLHTLALALAGVATLGFVRSRTTSEATQTTDAVTREITWDNSLHQLESDLRELLSQLHDRNLRTIIVLEELDKVEDSRGRQLEAVIRYFKNLFTQAPALFFFLTDRQYYDLIAERIEAAREDRTYAIEHTFFTHRVFVNRPTPRDGTMYLAEIAEGWNVSKAISDIAGFTTRRLRPLEDMDDMLERFVRVLLFRAQDHFFDLKNEVRRFVRVDNGRPYLHADEVTLPREEQGLAAFQFLVEQKMRRYGFTAGREYANEVLRSCLYSVLQSMRSSDSYDLTDSFPSEGERGDLLPREHGDQIIEAVRELALDLASGGALSLSTAAGGEVLTWEPMDQAIRQFSPVGQPTGYERDLVNTLQSLKPMVDPFGSSGQLSGVGFAEKADELIDRWTAEIDEFKHLRTEITVREKEEKESQANRELRELIGQAFEAHRLSLTNAHKLTLSNLATSTFGSLWRLDQGSTPLSSDTGVVLLAYGVGDRLRDAVLSLLNSNRSLQRLGLVIVNVAETDRWPAGQQASWEGVIERESPAVRHRLVDLATGLTDSTGDGWGNAVVDALLSLDLWANQPAPDPSEHATTGPFHLRHSSGEACRRESLTEVLEHWLVHEDSTLAWPAEYGPSMQAVRSAMYGSEVFTKDGPSLLIEPHWASSLTGNKREAWRAPFERLAGDGSVVVGFDNVWDSSSVVLQAPMASQIVIGRIPEQANTETISLLSSTDEPAAWAALGDYVRDVAPDIAEPILDRAASENYVAALVSLAELRTALGNPAAEQTRRDLVATGDAAAIAELGFRLPAGEAKTEMLTEAARGGLVDAMIGLAADSSNNDAERWRQEVISVGTGEEIHRLAERTSDPDLRTTAYEAAVEKGSTASLAALVRLSGATTPEDANPWFDLLVKAGEPSQLRRLARETDQPAVERGALDAAAALDDTEAIVELVVLLDDPDSADSHKWIDKLVALEEADSLMELTWSTDNQELVTIAYEAAADLGNVDAIEELVGRFEPDDPKRAGLWLDKLVRLGETRVLSDLGERLDDPALKRLAREGAAGLGDIQNMSALVTVLQKDDPKGARRWLDRLVEEEQTEELWELAENLESPELRLPAYRAVAELDDDTEATVELILLLENAGEAEERQSWLQRLIADEDGSGADRLLERTDDPALTQPIWRARAVNGDSGAMVELAATLAANKDGDVAAQQWWKRLEETSDERAMHELARRLDLGDLKSAVYSTLVERRYWDAYAEAADLVLADDPDRARSLLDAAAEQGQVAAIERLSELGTES